VQRRALRGVVVDDLSLPVLVTKIAGSEEAWRAVVICEVMLKETAERIRRQEIAASPAPVGGDGGERHQGGRAGGRRRFTSTPHPLRLLQSGGAKE